MNCNEQAKRAILRNFFYCNISLTNTGIFKMSLKLIYMAVKW